MRDPSPEELDRLWPLVARTPITPEEIDEILGNGWPPPRERAWGPFTYGVSGAGYGRWLRIGRRVSFASTGATSRMWPRVILGGDENCNRSVTVVLWPLGHVDVWWEPRWRSEPCDDCKREERR